MYIYLKIRSVPRYRRVVRVRNFLKTTVRTIVSLVGVRGHKFPVDIPE